MQTLRSKLEEKIQSKHLLNHTFYQRWQAGELTKEELQGYAKEYYAFEKEFPRFLSALHTKCEDQEIRQGILENLMDEENGSENHIELWLRFAEGLGVKRDEVKNHFISDETEHLLRIVRKHIQSDGIVSGLASLYAYERQQPDVAREKIKGLEKFYGLTEGDGTQFFKVHQVYDVHHAETEANILHKICSNEGTETQALEAASETIDALYDFLDGVERRYRNTKCA